MQALTKRRPTKKRAKRSIHKVGVRPSTGRTMCFVDVEDRRYGVSKDVIPKICEMIRSCGGYPVLKNHDLKATIKTDSVPWREAFKEELAQPGGEPGLMLRGLRARDGLTQDQLAEKIDEKQPNIAAMENGNRPISKKMAQRLALAFGVDYRVFL